MTDVPKEAVAGWEEYAADVHSFDSFESEYHNYIQGECLPASYKPAISVADLFKRPALPVTSYVPGFIYAGSLNLVAGEPKAGKSTLVWHIINAISQGTSFLDKESRKTNVLYVSEQNEVSFRQETANIPGFTKNPNIFVLLPEVCPAQAWSERIEFWNEKLHATQSNILVIDTFGAFAVLPPGGENDAACIAERLMALKKLYRERPSLGIVLVHHIRKPSTDPRYAAKAFADLRDARGSSALAGGVDNCVMLTKEETFTNIRNIHIEGRFIPEEHCSIALTEKGYVTSNLIRKPYRR